MFGLQPISINRQFFPEPSFFPCESDESDFEYEEHGQEQEERRGFEEDEERAEAVALHVIKFDAMTAEPIFVIEDRVAY